MQRARGIPGGLYSRDHQAGRRLRPGEGVVRSGQGAAVQCHGIRTGKRVQFYRGRGNRIEESVRGFGYHNQDLAFVKNARVAGGTNLQLRVEVFNLWNWHMFTDGPWGNSAFNTDLSSPDFGRWNGTVTDPRSIQLAARLEF